MYFTVGNSLADEELKLKEHVQANSRQAATFVHCTWCCLGFLLLGSFHPARP